MEGLSRMEYRGYDSAGLAVVKENSAKLFRNEGRVDKLKEKMAGKDLSWPFGHCPYALGNSWIPSEKNAHPSQIAKVKFLWCIMGL